jgi:hypothetical protein
MTSQNSQGRKLAGLEFRILVWSASWRLADGDLGTGTTAQLRQAQFSVWIFVVLPRRPTLPPEAQGRALTQIRIDRWRASEHDRRRDQPRAGRTDVQGTTPSTEPQ